nr:DUF790 family protein [Deinobacterium chartae]
MPSELLMLRYRGEELVPKRLELSERSRAMAREIIDLYAESVGRPKFEIEERLELLEGEDTDYRVKRGLAHLAETAFAQLEVRSPLEPQALRERVFSASAGRAGDPAARARALAAVAEDLAAEGLPSSGAALQEALYADLPENHILTAFEPPEPDALLHRYNLAQAQGVLYRAFELVITAHRNDPGEYKQLFRYVKLFGLMTTIEGDADHGFTLTLDGPTSLFRPSTRYGLSMAKLLPALLNVSRWSLTATLRPRRDDPNAPETARFTLDSDCGLVSHYRKDHKFDSILEEAFAARFEAARTEWQLEREVDLVPLPGSAMIPDFRLVHPDGRSYLLEIVGYWRPEYLRRKFAQVARSGRSDLILAVSERLNLEGAGVRVSELPPGVKLVWFKGKLDPKAVLAALEG